MTNQGIAKLFRNIAVCYILKNENRFKITAYEKAAETIVYSDRELMDLWKENKLNALSGIGKTISGHLEELFRTGKVEYFDKILNDFPESLFPLLDVPGIGPKKAFKLVRELELTDKDTVIDELLKFAKMGRVASIDGFGETSEKELIEALEGFKIGQVKEKRMSLYYADQITSKLTSYLAENLNCLEIFPLGSLRRMRPTIGDIDIAVSTREPVTVINWFLAYPGIEKLIEKGPSGASVYLSNNFHADLRVIEPDSLGSMLQYFTGSKQHNIRLREFALKKGLSLSEYGIKEVGSQKSEVRNYNDEVGFYYAIGLPWIPPELRENHGEIEAAISGTLPKLVEVPDIRGDLHIHSDYDLQPSHDLGISPLTDILSVAISRGYEYIGISDHNPSVSNHTEDEIIAIMKKRKLHFEQIMMSNKYTRIHLYILCEVDIQPDGSLALPLKAFDYVDAVIVSIHSSFKMSKIEATERILKGLSNPKAKILGHPTGKLFGKREGYDADWEKIFKFCTANRKAVEINSNPDRLDLNGELIRSAIGYKTKLVINSDSHETRQMDYLHYGVSQARRGWAQKEDILNSLSYDKINRWLKS